MDREQKLANKSIKRGDKASHTINCLKMKLRVTSKFYQNVLWLSRNENPFSWTSKLCIVGVWSIQVDRDTLFCQSPHATKTCLSGEPQEVGRKQTSVASFLPVPSPPKFRVRRNHAHRSWHLKERCLRERERRSPLCLQGTRKSSWAPSVYRAHGSLPKPHFAYRDTAVCLLASDFTSPVSMTCTQPRSEKHILRENATFEKPLL